MNKPLSFSNLRNGSNWLQKAQIARYLQCNYLGKLFKEIISVMSHDPRAKFQDLLMHFGPG